MTALRWSGGASVLLAGCVWVGEQEWHAPAWGPGDEVDTGNVFAEIEFGYQDGGGRTLALGDLDEDGAADLLVGELPADVYGAVWSLGEEVTPRYSDADTGAGPDAIYWGSEATGELEGFQQVDGWDVGRGREPVLVLAAPGNDPGGCVDEGTVYLVPTAFDGTQYAEDAPASWSGSACGDRFGAALATDPDAAGDDRLYVAAPDADGGAGRVYALASGANGGHDVGSEAFFSLAGASASDAFGTALAFGAVSDAASSDAHDLVVGAPSAEGGDGAVYLLTPPTGGWSSAAGTWSLAGDDPTLPAGTKAVTLRASGQVCVGTRAGAFGVALLADHDLDGDGVDDLFVGDPCRAVEDVPDAGAVFGVPGPIDTSEAELDLDDAVADGTASELHDTSGALNLGWGLAAGDLDQDGTDDLVILRTPKDTVCADGEPAGPSWLLFGPVSETGPVPLADRGSRISLGDVTAAAIGEMTFRWSEGSGSEVRYTDAAMFLGDPCDSRVYVVRHFGDGE